MQFIDLPAEADLPPLMERFYGRVRADAVLGPVFAASVDDWPEHLNRIASFWSSVMLSSGRYKGQPVRVHLAIAHRITPAMFERWLAIWRECTDAMLPREAAEAMQSRAARIAESLQLAIAHPTVAQRAAAESHAAISATTPKEQHA